MAQSMLQITPNPADAATADAAAAPPQVTPHLLPCRIHHTGPVGAADAWAPREKDNTQIAYFRGRKLHGRPVALPAGYRGVVGVRQAAPTGNDDAQAAEVVDVDATPAEQAAERQQRATGTVAAVGAFEGIVVWGHEQTAEAAMDPYVRGLEEWVAVSGEIHSYE